MALMPGSAVSRAFMTASAAILGAGALTLIFAPDVFSPPPVRRSPGSPS